MQSSQPLKLIYRYHQPTKLDTADYKCICKVSSSTQYNPSECEYYIQLSLDSENPRWEIIGSMQLGVEEILLKLTDVLK